MISRRTLLGGAGAAVVVGGAAAVAIKLSGGGSVRNTQNVAPKFSVEALNGRKRYELADFAGGVLLLNFWATWCGPCRVEMPLLTRTYQAYRARGLTILGINMDDGDMPAVQRFAREMGVNYPIALNNDAIVSAYGGIRFMPESFVIGRHGEILQRFFGMPSTGDLEAAIVSALSGK